MSLSAGLSFESLYDNKVLNKCGQLRELFVSLWNDLESWRVPLTESRNNHRNKLDSSYVLWIMAGRAKGEKLCILCQARKDLQLVSKGGHSDLIPRRENKTHQSEQSLKTQGTNGSLTYVLTTTSAGKNGEPIWVLHLIGWEGRWVTVFFFLFFLISLPVLWLKLLQLDSRLFNCSTSSRLERTKSKRGRFWWE